MVGSVGILGTLSGVFLAFNFQAMKDYRIRRELVAEYGEIFEFEFLTEPTIIRPYSVTCCVDIHCADFCEDEFALDKLCELPCLEAVAGTMCDEDEWNKRFTQQGIYWHDLIRMSEIGLYLQNPERYHTRTIKTNQ